MNLKTLIIHKNKTLYNILEEVSNYINFKTIYSENLDENLDELKNYIVLTPKKITSYCCCDRWTLRRRRSVFSNSLMAGSEAQDESTIRVTYLCRRCRQTDTQPASC